MTLISIRMEDQLEGTSKFNTWKERVLNLLKEHDIDSFMNSVVEQPTTNAIRINCKKNQAKEKRIIYEYVKDNLMSMTTPFKTTKECFETLMNLYEKKAPTQNTDLKNKLHNLNMEKDETIASFFTNISQGKYHLVGIGVVTNEDDLLQTAIDGIPSSWDTFLAALNGREVDQNLEILWHDCIQKEGRIQSTGMCTKEEILP